MCDNQFSVQSRVSGSRNEPKLLAKINRGGWLCCNLIPRFRVKLDERRECSRESDMRSTTMCEDESVEVSCSALRKEAEC